MIILMLGGPFMLDTHDWPVWAQGLFAAMMLVGAIAMFVRAWK